MWQFTLSYLISVEGGVWISLEVESRGWIPCSLVYSYLVTFF